MQWGLNLEGVRDRVQNEGCRDFGGAPRSVKSGTPTKIDAFAKTTWLRNTYCTICAVTSMAFLGGDLQFRLSSLLERERPLACTYKLRKVSALIINEWLNTDRTSHTPTAMSIMQPLMTKSKCNTQCAICIRHVNFAGHRRGNKACLLPPTRSEIKDFRVLLYHFSYLLLEKTPTRT